MVSKLIKISTKKKYLLLDPKTIRNEKRLLTLIWILHEKNRVVCALNEALNHHVRPLHQHVQKHGIINLCEGMLSNIILFVCFTACCFY